MGLAAFNRLRREKQSTKAANSKIYIKEKEKDLEEFTKDELFLMAKKEKIKHSSRITKNELIEVIKHARKYKDKA